MAMLLATRRAREQQREKAVRVQALVQGTGPSWAMVAAAAAASERSLRGQLESERARVGQLEVQLKDMVAALAARAQSVECVSVVM